MLLWNNFSFDEITFCHSLAIEPFIPNMTIVIFFFFTDELSDCLPDLSSWAINRCEASILARLGKVYSVDNFIWEFKQQQRKWLMSLNLSLKRKFLSIPWKSYAMYHIEEDFNMSKEDDGQAIHQPVKGDCYISGLWQWHSIIDKYFIQKQNSYPM